MSCFGCNRKYGLFCKEYGCPNCGYSYCSKCLKRPIAVPRRENKLLNVCLICYDKLSKTQAVEKVIDCEALPAIARHHSANQGEKLRGPDSLFENDLPENLGDVLSPINQGLGPSPSQTAEPADIAENLDCLIGKRLKDLKANNESEVSELSDTEIRARLQNLNGIPQKDYSKKDLLLNTDQRTDQEKMNDLLQQFLGETQLDQRIDNERIDAISDIERRLRALRDAPIDDDVTQRRVGTATDTPSDNEDDETMLKNIMDKYLAESRLPEAASAGVSELEQELAANVPPPPVGSGELEELPWCSICNEDAVYRCHGCDGELYCAPCFADVHADNDEEYRSHARESYKAPPKFKENHF